MGSFCGAHWCSWHIEHLLMSISMSVLRWGQYTASLARCFVFSMPKCPMWSCWRISSRCSKGITIRWPLTTSGNDSLSTIASSSRTVQKSGICFVQRRRSLGQPDWIVRISTCIAALIFSIRAPVSAVRGLEDSKLFAEVTGSQSLVHPNAVFQVIPSLFAHSSVQHSSYTLMHIKWAVALVVVQLPDPLRDASHWRTTYFCEPKQAMTGPRSLHKTASCCCKSSTLLKLLRPRISHSPSSSGLGVDQWCRIFFVKTFSDM